MSKQELQQPGQELARRKWMSRRRDRIVPDWLGWLAVGVALLIGGLVAWLKLG